VSDQVGSTRFCGETEPWGRRGPQTIDVVDSLWTFLQYLLYFSWSILGIHRGRLHSEHWNWRSSTERNWQVFNSYLKLSWLTFNQCSATPFDEPLPLGFRSAWPCQKYMPTSDVCDDLLQRSINVVILQKYVYVAEEMPCNVGKTRKSIYNLIRTHMCVSWPSHFRSYIGVESAPSIILDVSAAELLSDIWEGIHRISDLSLDQSYTSNKYWSHLRGCIRYKISAAYSRLY